MIKETSLNQNCGKKQWMYNGAFLKSLSIYIYMYFFFWFDVLFAFLKNPQMRKRINNYPAYNS